jgi:hypothetical protein
MRIVLAAIVFWMLCDLYLKWKLARTSARAKIGLLLFVDLPPKMSDSSTLTAKVNPLMNLFLKREAAQPLPQKKPSKKIKPSDE